MSDSNVRQRRAKPEAADGGLPQTTSARRPAPTWTWSNYDSWPYSVKFFPFALALLGCGVAIFYFEWAAEQADVDMSSIESCVGTFNYTFRINAATSQAKEHSTHDWEIGTAAEAILELIRPEKSVFGVQPFPGDAIPSLGWWRADKAVVWPRQRIRSNERTLFPNEWGVSDPCALGVPAIMGATRTNKLKDAALSQLDYLLTEAPRYSNGAISHRTAVAELWSDAVFMVPPFLAYLGVAQNDMTLIKQAVHQCQLYRDVLLIHDGSRQGLWKHIVGPSEMADDGAWSTGNAWAAYGMARVRATIAGWQPSKKVMPTEIDKLDQWIAEIIDGAIRTDNDKSGLLRNYLGDEDWFGETSGTSLLAAAAYRMAVQKPEVFGQPKYLNWANEKRRAILSRVDDDGFLGPAVNPLKHDSRDTINNSTEGESFLVILASAWRDCICRGVCSTADVPMGGKSEL